MLRAIGETALVTKADIRACKTCWSRRRKDAEDAEDAKDAETQDARRKTQDAKTLAWSLSIREMSGERHVKSVLPAFQ